jgi:hypothetical protein
MEGVELIVNNKLVEEQLEGVDVLFTNRFVNGLTIKDILRLRLSYGFKIVIDNDDHWELDPHHILYKTYEEHGVRQAIQRFVEIADVCMVTHERLYDETIKLNPNCHILPNAIPRFDQFDITRTESEFTRLFYAGSETHVKDVELLRNPVKRFDFKNTEMVLGGYVKDHPRLTQMATAYTNGGKLRHRVIEYLPVQEYYRAYILCDIGLIPLIDSKFNQHKSNLKILEAANVSAPVVVSKVNPYLGFPEDVVNYVTGQGDWYRHVKTLVNDPAMAKDQGVRLKDYCDEHFNFHKINKERKQILEYVTGKQAEIRKVPASV